MVRRRVESVALALLGGLDLVLFALVEGSELRRQHLFTVAIAVALLGSGVVCLRAARRRWPVGGVTPAP